MNEQQHSGEGTKEHQEPDKARKQQPDGATNGRLLGVLHDLADDVGPGKTAAMLGVDRKTLWRVLKEGRLTPRLVRTLERQARTPAGQNAARSRTRRDAMERRVAALERELPRRIEVLRGEVRALTAALANTQEREQTEPPARNPERTGVVAQESEPGGSDTQEREGTPAAQEREQTEPPAQGPSRTRVLARERDRTRAVAPEEAWVSGPPPVRGVAQPVIGLRPVTKPRRDHPELVTLVPEVGEELVYGEATPLIVEWRAARAAFLGTAGSRVERAGGWVRMCELELVLAGEHGLTLPPDTYPWDGFRREEELWRRRRSLGNAHRERRRALRWRFLRRLLTLGLRQR